jgi:FkbM family methyltransferase
MFANFLVRFYRIWHGWFGLKGAGWTRRRAARVVPGLRAYPLVMDDGTRVTLDFRDMSAWYWLNFDLGDVGFEEEGLLQAMRARITLESVMWDVGANAGLLSYLLSKSSPTPRELHLFEQNPHVFAIARSGLSNFAFAHVHRAALSDRRCQLRLNVPIGHSTLGALAPEGGTEVQCLRGDDLVFDEKMTPPDIIKIDTEGHELSVLKGLERIIDVHRPCIFFEHLSLTDEEVEKAIPAGYHLFSLSDADGSLKPGFNRGVGHNSVLFPQEQIAD